MLIQNILCYRFQTTLSTFLPHPTNLLHFSFRCVAHTFSGSPAKRFIGSACSPYRSKSNSWIHIIFKINYLHAIAHLQFDLFLVHTLQVSIDVHFLFGLVHTKRTRKLWLFATLPLLMVAQRRLQLIESSALGTWIALAVLWFAIGRFTAIDARVFLLLLRFLMGLRCVQIVVVIILKYRSAQQAPRTHIQQKNNQKKRKRKKRRGISIGQICMWMLFFPQ